MAIEMTTNLFEVIKEKKMTLGKMSQNYFSNIFSGHVLNFQANFDLCDLFYVFDLIL